jgi:hypothetical protein
MSCCVVSKSETGKDSEEYANEVEGPPKKDHAPAKDSKHVPPDQCH